MTTSFTVKMVLKVYRLGNLDSLGLFTSDLLSDWCSASVVAMAACKPSNVSRIKHAEIT